LCRCLKRYICCFPWYVRIFSAAGGLLLIVPGVVSDIIGIVLLIGVCVMQYLLAGRRPISKGSVSAD